MEWFDLVLLLVIILSFALAYCMTEKKTIGKSFFGRPLGIFLMIFVLLMGSLIVSAKESHDNETYLFLSADSPLQTNRQEETLSFTRRNSQHKYLIGSLVIQDIILKREISSRRYYRVDMVFVRNQPLEDLAYVEGCLRAFKQGESFLSFLKESNPLVEVTPKEMTIEECVARYPVPPGAEKLSVETYRKRLGKDIF